MADFKKTTTSREETDVQRAARELGERVKDESVSSTPHTVAGGSGKAETKAEREAREADDSVVAGKLNQLGRIEEIRASLSRGHDNYRQSVDQAQDRLQALVGASADADVEKAAKAVAEAFNLKLDPKGFTQPPAAKGPSPFVDPAKK